MSLVVLTTLSAFNNPRWALRNGCPLLFLAEVLKAAKENAVDVEFDFSLRLRQGVKTETHASKPIDKP
jgi:hypothetical protein